MRIYYNEDVPNTFYFAEGYTGAGFREYLCLGNSSSATVKVKVIYLVKDGTPIEKTYDVPAFPLHRRRQCRGGSGQGGLHQVLSPSAFIAERPMYFDYQGGGRQLDRRIRRGRRPPALHYLVLRRGLHRARL